MSRCFPFPPPGYENKARPNDLNLIIKEKDKHKKHKKHKDKKERSERKHKERAEGKHKEDKDRKQKKHKDKKDKKEKQKSSEENKIVGPPSENQNGEKLGNGWHDNGNPVELGKRIENCDGAMDEKQRFLEEKKIINHPENRNSEKMGPGNISCDGAHGLGDMGTRISNGDKKELKRKSSADENKISRLHSENRIGERPGPYNNPGDGGRNHIISVEQKMDNMKEKHKPFEAINIAGPSEIRKSENARLYNNPGYGAHEHRVLFEMEKRVEAKCSGNNWVGNFSGEKQISVEKKKEGKEKTKLGNSAIEGDGLENKNRDKNKEDKKRKREDKVKSKERKIKQRASDGNLLDLCVNKPVDLLKGSWDKQGKLPELEEQFTLNGVLHEENGTQPDNTSRSAISSREVSQNGNVVHHPCHKNTIIPLVAEKQQALIMNHTVNGGKFPSPQSVIKNVWNSEPGPIANNSSPEPMRACIKNHDVGHGSHVQNGRRKESKDKVINKVNGVLEGNKVISPSPPITKDLPPHPDLKYLTELLTVPKIEPPQFIDNDEKWLFGSKDAKSAKFGSAMVECTERVWADAIRLKSADVVAMPYVNIF